MKLSHTSYNTMKQAFVFDLISFISIINRR